MRKIHRIFTALMLVAFAVTCVFAVACADRTEDLENAQAEKPYITLDRDFMEMAVGDVVTLTASYDGGDDGPVGYNWTAKGDAVGIGWRGNICSVTAQKTGEAVVSVTVGYVSASCGITVT